MDSNSGFPWKTVLIIVIVFMLLCCCLTAIAGAAMYYIGGETDFSRILEENPVEELIEPEYTLPQAEVTEEVLEEATPEETEPEIPTESDETEPVVELTGQQELSDYYFFDDLSSNAFDWYQYDDGSTIFLLEDETYTIQIKDPEGFDWVYFPVDFYPHEMSFDVRSLDADDDGTFGVFCNYLDTDNYYYLEFDLGTKEYVIGKYINDVQTPLTKKTDVDYFWNTTTTLKNSQSVNRIGISCYPTSITMFINDEMVENIEVPESLEVPGKAGLYLYTFENADEDGYKVSFDNVEVFEPQQ